MDWSKPAVSDSIGTELTYGEMFLRAIALGRVLERTLGPEPYVGVLLPPLANSAVVNLSLALWGKIAVNLNYTAGQAVLDSSIQQCGIRHVITASKALDRFKLHPAAELVMLEDLPRRVTMLDKVWAGMVGKVIPLRLLDAYLPGFRDDHLGRAATVIFTSGSTGDPKGVVLSHGNILANIHAVGMHLDLKPDEVLIGILPLFHSMGYTVTLWMSLCLGKKTVFHVNPLDARIVGELCLRNKVTLLICAPTFMRTYLHKCDAECFSHLRYLVLGAEKLKPELARDIREKLGFEALEGYGTTELSPVVAVNVPYQIRLPDGRPTAGNHLGTVGRLVPGTAVKSIDPDTGEDLPPGREGLVCVKGPQVMVGYLGRPEATSKVLKDGWYNTGDLGFLDEDGFLRITGRLSRFSKVGGEMVPHEAVESAIRVAADVTEQQVAVTGIPDVKRGEKLVVLIKDFAVTPREIVQRLNATDLPKLWIPGAEDFLVVDEIPILGTGKFDLRGIHDLAAAAQKRPAATAAVSVPST